MSSLRPVVVFAAAVLLGCAAVASEKPNILFILSDDQRWDTIHALGNAEISTPNQDRLVERGFAFRNAYCQGAMVPAVCLPSRGMIITGRSLWRLPENLRAKTPPPGVTVLPTLMSQAGYVTFHTGKAGNSCTFGNAAFDTNLESKGRTATSATEHAENVIGFLRKHNGAKPFFAYMAPEVPHDPRLAPERFVKMYDPAKLTLSKNFMPQHPFDNGELRVRDELLAAIPRQPDEMRQHLADYYATISHLDFEIGRIFDVLQERGWLENTIIIYSSDQGLAVGGRHGLMGKQNLYEDVKPPLIFAGPGIPHGQTDALVYLYDLFPTILALAGGARPEGLDSRDLLPVIRGEKPRVRDTLFGAYRQVQRMVRDERWKLLKYNAAGDRHAQLFDLANDPDELKNLAVDPAHAAERTRLEAELAKARQQFGDPVKLDF
jgi:arylsulfatase A-like enzyme